MSNDKPIIMMGGGVEWGLEKSYQTLMKKLYL